MISDKDACKYSTYSNEANMVVKTIIYVTQIVMLQLVYIARPSVLLVLL